MFNWRVETGYVGRYSVSGVVNTVVGFSIIFLLTYLGFSPVAANVAGYAGGLISGFYLSRVFVFKQGGNAAKQGAQYFGAFLVAFLVNLGVLKLVLSFTHLPVMLAQLASAIAYTFVIFVISRYLIFSESNTKI